MPNRTYGEESGLMVADVVRTKNVTRYIDAKDCTLTDVFKAPKGQHFVFLFLGTAARGERFDAMQALKDMGWTPPAELEADVESSPLEQGANDQG
jgi:hypothetical protein